MEDFREVTAFDWACRVTELENSGGKHASLCISCPKCHLPMRIKDFSDITCNCEDGEEYTMEECFAGHGLTGYEFMFNVNEKNPDTNYV